MSSYTEQDELEKLKEWWKNYGGAMIIGVLLGLGLLFGNKYWTQYREEQRVAASNLYAQLLQEVQASNYKAAGASAKKLMDEYKRTPYAGMAALMLARLSYEANDTAAARDDLKWAIEHATDDGVVNAARLRLGRLYLAAKEYDAALAVVQKDAPGFEAEYLELKGDAYVGLGKPTEARAAYGDALKMFPPQTSGGRLIEMKLDDLGGGGRE